MGTSKTTAGLWNGDFAELIIYSQTLSATDRNKIESYLALKYAITLDNTLGGTAGDYNSSAGTRITSYNVCYTKLLRVKRRKDKICFLSD